jgi:broad specificity phosphatase PhoE
MVAAACGVGLVELPALAEIDFGELDGLTHEQARAEFPEVYAAWLESPATLRFPGGESLADVRTRVAAAAEGIVERHPGATVALLSHAGPLRALIASCLLVPDEALFRLVLDHASTSVVDWFDDGVPIVRCVNGRSASPAPGA